ncbi:MAG: AsmA-like C-terminal region-containing protein [Gammaproteobacteria bacterium]
MTVIKKTFISLLFITVLLFLTIVITYISLIYKPENIIFVANKYFSDDFIIEYKSVDSDRDLISPGFNFEDIVVKDTNNKTILEAEKIAVGINLVKSFTTKQINLTFLDLKDFSYVNRPNSIQRKDFKLIVNKTDIKSEIYNLQANNSLIESHNGKISITNDNGKLNNIIFKELNIFNEYGSNKIFYSAVFNLDEKIIDNEKLINLEAFLDYEIDLKIQSKGYFDTDLKDLRNLNKFIFNKSSLITNTEYSIKEIDLVINTNLNKNLSGIFNASIPDQNIKGSILIKDQLVTVRSKLKFDMSKIANYDQYLQLDGLEEFMGVLTINDDIVSLDLETNLSNTRITSVIDDLNKNKGKNLKTKINISDLSKPTYFIKNANFRSHIGPNNTGYFAFGNNYYKDIQLIDYKDGFYIFLSLKKLDMNKLSFSNQVNKTSGLISIKSKIKELNFFENTYNDQEFEVYFKENNIDAVFAGKDLNGMIKVDETGFMRIDLFDTKFEFKDIEINKSQNNFNIEEINLRFVGRNIQTYDNLFQDIDFYLLRNESITTLDNINASSKNLNIGPDNNNEKAFISYNRTNDMYRVRGSYKINNENKPLKAFIDYDFEYLSTDLNIQWNSMKQLKNLEGRIDFLLKDFKSDTSLGDSALLRALKIFNLNAVIENINNEVNITSSNLYINRAEGDFYIGQNRALIRNPIKIETSEAKMSWKGDIYKNSEGILNNLNLDLDMRLKVSENIPWYAAIFGGIPALAGGLVLENVFEDNIDNVSTFKFKVKGSVEEPLIERLN